MRHNLTSLPSAEEMYFHPQQQEIRFGVLPIRAPDGITPLGLAATALLQQGDTHALMELAHFANNGRERADQYLDNVEDTLDRGGSARSAKHESWSAQSIGLPSRRERMISMVNGNH